MKQIFTESKKPAFEGRLSFVNLYLDGFVASDSYDHFAEAKEGRRKNGHGVTVRIRRTEDGDFHIESWEEF